MAHLSLVRDINQARVLDLLRRREATSRAELAQKLRLTRSTLSSLINDLVAKGFVVETDERVFRHASGRPGIGLKIDTTGGYFIGAELGVGHLNVVMLDLSATPIAHRNGGFDTTLTPQQVIGDLADLIEDVAAETLDDVSRLRGIGVTVPATEANGAIVLSPLLGWHDVDIRTPLEARFRVPILVENDANAAALAQVYVGNGSANRNVVYLSLGAGVGAGIVIDGKIFRGSFGAAGEVGYLRLSPTGPADRKGIRGTLEAYAGAPTLLERYRVESGHPATLAALLAGLEASEPAALRVVEEWGNWLGRGVVSLMNVLNPERIVVGGLLSPLLPWVRAHLIEVVKSEPLPGSSSVEIGPSRYGSDDNAIGGAILVYHSMFSVPEIVPAR